MPGPTHATIVTYIGATQLLGAYNITIPLPASGSCLTWQHATLNFQGGLNQYMDLSQTGGQQPSGGFGSSAWGASPLVIQEGNDSSTSPTSAQDTEIWATFNGASPNTTVTGYWTRSSTALYGSDVIAEWPNVVSAGTVDNTATAIGTTSGDTFSFDLVASHGPDLVLMSIAVTNGNNPPFTGVDGGFTAFAGLPGGTSGGSYWQETSTPTTIQSGTVNVGFMGAEYAAVMLALEENSSGGQTEFPPYPIYAFGAVAPGTNGAGPTDSGSPKLTFSQILNPIAPPSSPPSGFVPGSYVQGAGHAGR